MMGSNTVLMRGDPIFGQSEAQSTMGQGWDHKAPQPLGDCRWILSQEETLSLVLYVKVKPQFLI